MPRYALPTGLRKLTTVRRIFQVRRAVFVTQAHDANDHFIYNKTTGGLYFDKDGKGGAASVEIAILDHHPVFNFHDMLIIA